MIDLALLCNLYADGPTTLGRLKEFGCESLEDVVALSGTDLGWALQESSDSCERFRREARLLRERRGPDPSANPSAAEPPHVQAVAPTAVGRATSDGSIADEPAGLEPTALSAESNSERRSESASDSASERRSGESSRRDGSLLDVLLRAWRRASGRDEDENAVDAALATSADGPADGPIEDPEGSPAPSMVAGAERGTGETSLSEFRPANDRADEYRADEYRSASDRAVDHRVGDVPGHGAAGRGVPAESEQRVELHAAPRRNEVSAASMPAATSLPASSTSSSSRSSIAALPAAIPQAAAPLPERVQRGTPLSRVGFDGVEADYANQLEGLGIDTVEDFLASQPLDLAGRSSMRYTVLLRMQFVARRELERVL